MKGRLALAALLATAAPGPARAAELQITKTTIVVSDQVSLINPRALPGSTIDVSLVVVNPLANTLLPVRRVVIVDVIPTTEELRVADYGVTGSGPVSFADGNLLNLGLLGSGLSVNFAGLPSTTDGIEFSDGTSWSYTPTPDADGFDARVRAIRVTISGTHATGSAFRLIYRMKLK